MKRGARERGALGRGRGEVRQVGCAHEAAAEARARAPLKGGDKCGEGESLRRGGCARPH